MVIVPQGRANPLSASWQRGLRVGVSRSARRNLYAAAVFLSSGCRLERALRELMPCPRLELRVPPPNFFFTERDRPAYHHK